jgi:hypothetical protein
VMVVVVDDLAASLSEDIADEEDAHFASLQAMREHYAIARPG